MGVNPYFADTAAPSGYNARIPSSKSRFYGIKKTPKTPGNTRSFPCRHADLKAPKRESANHAFFDHREAALWSPAGAKPGLSGHLH